MSHEDLELRMYEISAGISNHSGAVWDLSEYTGNGKPLGIATVYNSPITTQQLAMALAMSQDSQLGSLEEQSLRIPGLIEEQVLSRLRILDLGCGYVPSFARCARVLGADVYTVDVIPSSDFVVEKWRNGKTTKWSDGFTQTERDVEIEKHIEVDLNSDNALEAIRTRTGGNMDLVTAAHLTTGGEYNGMEYTPKSDMGVIAMEMLRVGGVYFESPHVRIEVK